jgi:hypothetical protein
VLRPEDILAPRTAIRLMRDALIGLLTAFPAYRVIVVRTIHADSMGCSFTAEGFLVVTLNHCV